MLYKKDLEKKYEEWSTIWYNNLKNIILFMPLIDKVYRENIFYSCAQQGIINIIPVLYKNSTSKFNIKLEVDRINKIMISACEQSKQFNIPKIENILNYLY